MTVHGSSVHRGATAILAVALLAGCSSQAAGGAAPGDAQGQTALGDQVETSRTPAATPSRLPNKNRDPAVRLPDGWPRVVPVLGGTLTATNSRPGGYAVSFVATGSASEVQVRVLALYLAHGFVQADPQLLVLTGHRWQVTVVLANRDHSNLETNVVVAVHPA